MVMMIFMMILMMMRFMILRIFMIIDDVGEDPLGPFLKDLELAAGVLMMIMMMIDNLPDEENMMIYDDICLSRRRG